MVTMAGLAGINKQVEVSVEYTLSLVVGLMGIAVSAVLFAGHLVA